MRVDFYHLTRMPLERALPQIVERVVGAGERLLIVAADEAQRRAIDRLLWTYAPDSFLAHAEAGGSDDADQPVLIAADIDAANRARNVALIDGHWRDGALDFDRAFHFFDEDGVRAARAAWSGLGGRDRVERRYWRQNDAGRWEQAA